MNEAARTTAVAWPTASVFEFPMFAMPNFEMPKMEIPAEFREFAERSVSRAKETYERLNSAADEATGVFENTYATATKGASDYGLKVIGVTRVNSKSAFDFYTELMAVKSFSELVQRSTEYARTQFETVTTQTKELGALAQKVTTETFEPMKKA